jgi:aldose 1-epimerase
MRKDTITLSAGRYRAEIVPGAGGLLRSLTIDLNGRVHDILHCPAGSEVWGATPRFFGSWAMLPYANRAYGGVIDDGIVQFEVPLNDPSAGGAILGFGWQSAWALESSGDDRLSIIHRKSDGGDLYRYLARQTFELGADGLAVHLSITNEADQPLPHGIGQHPWFDKFPDTRLVMHCAGIMALAPGFKPIAAAPVPAALDFSAGQVVARNDELVASYFGWDGRMMLETPSRGIVIEMTASDTMRAPLAWSPADAPFVCVEPQSHVVGAPTAEISRALTPLARLANGETLTGTMTLSAHAFA